MWRLRKRERRDRRGPRISSEEEEGRRESRSSGSGLDLGPEEEEEMVVVRVGMRERERGVERGERVADILDFAFRGWVGERVDRRVCETWSREGSLGVETMVNLKMIHGIT